MGTPGHCTIATWNIRDGRNARIQAAARALHASNVDIAVLQEVNLREGELQYAPGRFKNYTIRVAPRDKDANVGGIALLHRGGDDAPFRVENDRARGPNIITFELVTGEEERWYGIGCYIPPSEKDGATARRVEELPKAWPEGMKPMVLGDLNADLENPRTWRRCSQEA